ncbi:MAG TPA: hypothetical protein VL242_53295 [Sorangium sp.]|nr:hypothetical protein [Sorangium sp.]
MNSAPTTLERAQRRLAAAGGRHIGDLISWNTDRIDVTREAARRVFATEGLGHLIPDMDPATALSRAAAEVKRPSGILVRPFARPKGDTSAAVGIYVQKTREGEAGDEYVCGARCRVDRHTGTIVGLPPDGAPPITEALAHAEAMAAHGNHLVTHAETRDISFAMVATAKALSGVPLRDRGGFYLVPPSTCGAWLRLRRGLEQLGVKPIRIEMHDAPDNVAVARAAAQGALEADVAELIADLDKAASEGMRQNALARRVELCKELTAKAELYRGVLAGVADRITARVKELQHSFQLQLDGGDGVSFTIPVVND